MKPELAQLRRHIDRQCLVFRLLVQYPSHQDRHIQVALA